MELISIEATSITCYECICILALVNWHAIASVWCCIICHLWPVWQYHIFSHYLINGMIKKKSCTSYIFLFLYILCNFCLKHFLRFRRIHWDINVIVCRSSHEVLLFLSDVNGTWISLTDFKKILKYQISWILVQWDPHCSMQADLTDRQTDLQTWWN